MLSSIQAKINPDNPWKERIQYFETITSTNDVLKSMAKEGAEHGTVLIANQQTGGRGRLGRSFLSPSDVGIYMSVLLRPNCVPAELMHLTCAAAQAACSAIECSAGISPGIKWTNDIVFQEKKLAGILTEMSLNQDQTVAYAIIGIGINCCQSELDFPEEIRGFAGSLSMVSGKNIDRAAVAAAMVDAFYQMDKMLLSDRDSIMESYCHKCITLGQYISIVRGDDIQHGKALSVRDDGALIVEYDDGHVSAVNSGEVSIRGMYHYV